MGADFMKAESDPHLMGADGGPHPMGAEFMGADGDQHLIGADATDACRW